MNRARGLDPALLARLAAEEERQLSPAELDARIATAMSAWEREDFAGLVSWFRRRYPTAGERMRAMRLKRLRQRTG